MTTAAAQPPPARVPTPRPKPSRTSSLPAEPTAVSASKLRPAQVSAATAGGAPLQQAMGARRGAHTAAADPLSDKATAFLIRRILCPQQADKGRSSPASIEDLLLPPLTSRNDVDLQLYALIAIILRDNVQNWHAKITPDESFVAEIVQIIAHITRALEQRLRKVDLESLLFDELPELLDKHVTAYRVAHDPITQPPVRTDPREIYHSLCPLPAMSPVPRPEDPQTVAAQAQSEAAYRQLLVHAFLAILLPTEDLENGCLTALVGQILSELIIGNVVANRLSEPWLIWELLIIASRAAGRRNMDEDEGRLEHLNKAFPNGRRMLPPKALFWIVLQWCFLAFSFIRMAFAVLVTSGSLPPRAPHGVASRRGAAKHETSRESYQADPQPSKTPVLAFAFWSAVSNFAEVDGRMPWLCGTLSMLQWIAVMGPGRIAGVDSRFDRLLSYTIQRHVLDAANLPPLLRTVRGVLFPNNLTAGKPTLVPPSSEAELCSLKRRCASAFWALVPKGMGRLYFGGGLLRPSPVLTIKDKKTEGSAQLRAVTTKHGGDRDKDKDLPRKNREEAKAKETPIETVASSAQTAQAQERGREGSRSGSRHQRSAPAPRPKTGGQGPLANASARADSPSSYVSMSGIRGEARSGGVASTQSRQTGCHDDGHRDAEADEEDKEILEEIERGMLDVFSDAYCNKHLVYSVLELILVRLLPELTEKGVLELLGERIPVEGLA